MKTINNYIFVSSTGLEQITYNHTLFCITADWHGLI